MTTDLITKADVLEIAFIKNINDARIADGMINMVQVKHLKPILSKKLYDDVVNNPTNYSALITLIKPILAYFVKYYLLPGIYNDISNTGINKVPGNNRTPGTIDDLGSVRQDCLDVAQMSQAALTDYLNDNDTLYPLYVRNLNPLSSVEIVGGIISRNEIPDDYYFPEYDGERYT
jgi:hypothetical protein